MKEIMIEPGASDMGTLLSLVSSLAVVLFKSNIDCMLKGSKESKYAER